MNSHETSMIIHACQAVRRHFAEMGWSEPGPLMRFSFFQPTFLFLIYIYICIWVKKDALLNARQDLLTSSLHSRSLTGYPTHSHPKNERPVGSFEGYWMLLECFERVWYRISKTV